MALPAVTVPSGRTTPLSLASASRVVSRGCSSWLTTMASPFFCGMVTGTISRARWPALMAATALSWLRRAIWSCASRSIWKSTATFSAVSGMESTPYCSFISLLTKRQPMVVSYTALLRLKALSALGMTKGARLMLSTPPAIIRPRLARLDGARGGAHGVQARAAQAVDGGAGHIDGQARQQAAHAGHVAVVFTGLVGAAVEHIVHGGPVHTGVALHQRLDGDGAQVVSAHAGQEHRRSGRRGCGWRRR